MNLLKAYLKVPLVKRVVAGLVMGALCGGGLWWMSALCGSQDGVRAVMRYCAPFGSVFVGMLKMIVLPTIFFSLVCGASALPLKKLGKVGGKIVLWYFASMTVASGLGIAVACFVNPGAGGSLAGWQELVRQFGAQSAGSAIASLASSSIARRRRSPTASIRAWRTASDVLVPSAVNTCRARSASPEIRTFTMAMMQR